MAAETARLTALGAQEISHWQECRVLRAPADTCSASCPWRATLTPSGRGPQSGPNRHSRRLIRRNWRGLTRRNLRGLIRRNDLLIPHRYGRK
ncbi:hypothetical protein NKH77_51885 [Streptomyces sp. M19]